MRVRFGRWSGTQDPFPVDVSAADVLDDIGDDLLAGVAPDEALRRLLRRGMNGRVGGLAELRRRVREARQREASRLGVEGPLRELQERLAGIVERERTALEFSAADDAGERLAELDALPDDPASQVRALEEHRWEDARAESDFRALVGELRRDVAQAAFGRLAGALGDMTDADLARLRDMLSELGDLVDAADRGEDTSEAFASFMQRYGDLLPDADSLDELLEELARRMAAMSRLLAGLDDEQRRQLTEMAEQVLGDMDLRFQAERLRRALEARHPELGWDQAPSGATAAGEGSGSLADTVDWVEHLQELEDLERALGQDYPGARLEDVDEELLRAAAGEDAARDLRGLREIERLLEQAGAAARRGGRLELTPRGVRGLSERALARMFRDTLTGGPGSHGTAEAGGRGEPTGTTRPLRFGDPFQLDIPRTVRNAVLREAGERAAGRVPAGRGVRLVPDDLELAESEQRVRAATVLLLDMSFSMPLRGNWVPAKRVALALQALVESRFPEDRFYVVGFSDFARRLQPRDLLAAGWERVYGTNMEHAFLLARRLLAAHSADEQQVIMVTDGEPTAHLEGDRAFFAWPPEQRTLRRTLAEARRLARTGATLNVFLLDHDPGAAAFVEHMVRAYGGRIFYADLADLGSLVVRDFLRRRAG